MLRLFANAVADFRIFYLDKRLRGLHADLDFVMVHSLLTEYLGETRRQLSNLCRHRAILGVNNNVARFHVGDPGMTNQGRRDGPLVKSLKFQQTSGLRR